MATLIHKLDNDGVDKWYHCFFYNMKLEMEADYRHKAILNRIMGGVSYVMDKSWLSARFLPPYSEERRQKASENAIKNGFNSQTNNNSDNGRFAVKTTGSDPLFGLVNCMGI